MYNGGVPNVKKRNGFHVCFDFLDHALLAVAEVAAVVVAVVSVMAVVMAAARGESDDLIILRLTPLPPAS